MMAHARSVAVDRGLLPAQRPGRGRPHAHVPTRDRSAKLRFARTRPQGSARARVLPAVLITALATLGCAPRSELRLLQPTAPPAQRNLALASDWAYYLDEGGHRFILLAFPLPGARDGPRDFLVYLVAPEGEGEHAIDPGDPAAAQGFLIQVVGRLKGKTAFESGTIRSRRRPLEGARRDLTLDVQCADGTQLTGRALIAPDARELRAFQRRYAGDVQRLAPPETQPSTTQPAELSAETGERIQDPPARP
jgi:hypothetical protein